MKESELKPETSDSRSGPPELVEYAFSCSILAGRVSFKQSMGSAMSSR